jgi:hypothetical protein
MSLSPFFFRRSLSTSAKESHSALWKTPPFVINTPLMSAESLAPKEKSIGLPLKEQRNEFMEKMRRPSYKSTENGLPVVSDISPPASSITTFPAA